MIKHNCPFCQQLMFNNKIRYTCSPCTLDVILDDNKIKDLFLVVNKQFIFDDYNTQNTFVYADLISYKNGMHVIEIPTPTFDQLADIVKSTIIKINKLISFI